MEEVPPTKPSEAELGGAAGSHGVFKGLWVGIQVSNANDYRLKAGNGFPRGKHAPKSGDGRQRKSIAQIIAAGKMIELPHDPKALRVVVNIDTLDSRVYVLANPDKNGLCQALPTQTEIVWYAPEYRDDSETRSEFARKACNAKIKLQLDTIKNRTMETTARPSRYTEFLPQHPTVTVMIELRRAFDDFRLWKGEGSLQKALKSVESLSKDLRARKQCEDRKILDHLLDIKRGFKPDEEKAAHKAVKVHLSRSLIIDDSANDHRTSFAVMTSMYSSRALVLSATSPFPSARPHSSSGTAPSGSSFTTGLASGVRSRA